MLTLRESWHEPLKAKCNNNMCQKQTIFMLFVCSFLIYCGITIIPQSPKTLSFKINPELSELERYRLKTTHHCEVVSIGCFIKKSKIIAPAISMSFKFMTRNWCWSFCSSSLFNKKTHAGLINGNFCVCAINFLDLATANYGNCSKSCNGERKETCGDVKNIEVFRLLSNCQKGALVPKEYGTSRLIGCFESPSKTVLDGKITKRRINLDCSECVLLCGMLNFPLALRNSENECLCWEMTKRLNLSHKQEQCNKKSLKVYRSLAEDKRCRSIQLLPALATRPICALVTFPGSGNTWARYLLEQATGLYTGSVYGDGRLHNNGFLGEKPMIGEGRTLVVKDHMMKRNNMPKYNAAILIIRNPYNAMIAEYQRSKTRSHTGTLNHEEFLTSGFKKFLFGYASLWYNVVDWVVTSGKPFHVVIFDDLVKDPIKETKAMVEFLQNSIHLHVDNLNQNLLCLSQQVEGHEKRKGSKLNTDPFTKDMKQLLNNNISKVRKLLVEYNVKKKLPNYERKI